MLVSQSIHLWGMYESSCRAVFNYCVIFLSIFSMSVLVGVMISAPYVIVGTTSVWISFITTLGESWDHWSPILFSVWNRVLALLMVLSMCVLHDPLGVMCIPRYLNDIDSDAFKLFISSHFFYLL